MIGGEVGQGIYLLSGWYYYACKSGGSAAVISPAGSLQCGAQGCGFWPQQVCLCLALSGGRGGVRYRYRALGESVEIGGPHMRERERERATERRVGEGDNGGDGGGGGEGEGGRRRVGGKYKTGLQG